MNAVDFSPLFRSAIGFDRLARLMESARAAAEGPSYPPYNIERAGEDEYTLTMAVAGFGPEDIEITTLENTLTVAGRARAAEADRRYLHRGIAGRAFERRFVLADHIQVTGASLENGLLQLSLKREVPEAKKPRRIALGSAPAADAPAAQLANDAAEAPAAA